MSCIKEIFPKGKIEVNGTNNYPIKVIVSAEFGGQKVTIWSGRQQDLFRKNAAKRERSMAEIKRNLSEFQEDVLGN